MTSTRPRLLALAGEGQAAPLGEAARAAGFGLVHVQEVGALLANLGKWPMDATLLSLSIEAVDESLAKRVAAEPRAGALFLSARGVSLERALLSERVGAVGYLREPLQESELVAQLSELQREGSEVELVPPEGGGAPSIVGESLAMSRVFSTIARVARSTSTVLLTGESGTGKEVVARALHEASERRDHAFVAVNCAAIPEHLLESELFGHEKGAFTGAVGRRRGRFERADGGTLFLDEIGDMSLNLQAKMLRALEERTIEPVGAESPMTVDVRCIAATNKDLAEAVSTKAFREDLYFRLAVVEVPLPPLRARRGDVRRLALHFASHFARAHARPIRAITERALARLDEHAWPGNVRELRNVLDRAVLLSAGDVLRSSSLRLGPNAPHAAPRPAAEPGAGYPVTASLAEVEADHIVRVLRFVRGHLSDAASMLGVHRNTLARKVRVLSAAGRLDPGSYS